jgi:hypothetical protein
MFELDPCQRLLIQSIQNQVDLRTHHYNRAVNLFRQALVIGKIARVYKGLLRRRQWLFDLARVRMCISLRGSYYSGVRAVAIREIIGSEGKTAAFDIDFHPVTEESRDRWVHMACLYLACEPLPPVALIQIGDACFVRDGHHRISVARAFGQTVVDAEVITWMASPPFPWQKIIRFQPVPLIR